MTERSIEISKVEKINKGVTQARFDVLFKESGVYANECVLFQKGTNRWVGMPSRKWEKDGEVKYKPLVSFKSDDLRVRKQKEILDAFDEFEKTSYASPSGSSMSQSEIPF